MSKGAQADRSATPKAIKDCHALLGWMLPQPDKFPRSRRFTLGSRIKDRLLFVLEKLVEAACTKAKGGGAADCDA
jgi:hypothetical protein